MTQPKPEDKKYPELNFDLAAYERVNFEMMYAGVVTMSFGKYSDETTFEFSEFGFNLKFETTGWEVEKSGIWNEFPKLFAEFHAEVTAERCGTCHRIFDTEGEDCPCWLDENLEMKDWNQSRRRFFGVRVGDFVEYTFGGLSRSGSVCQLWAKNNNKIKVELPGGFKDEVLPWNCKIIKRVEDL